MDEKVMVTSMVSGQIGIVMPELRVKKTWPKKGTKLPISKDFLREAIYDPGVEYMFKNGILDIDDMGFKIELGLEEEGTKTPTAILVVDDKFMNRLLKAMPIEEMRQKIGQMSEVQKNELVNYAAKQTDVNLDRIKVIDELCGVNLLKIIELNRSKEA